MLSSKKLPQDRLGSSRGDRPGGGPCGRQGKRFCGGSGERDFFVLKNIFFSIFIFFVCVLSKKVENFTKMENLIENTFSEKQKPTEESETKQTADKENNVEMEDEKMLSDDEDDEDMTDAARLEDLLSV